MSKDAYYFPHDSNARHDPKILAMITVYGMEGYGWYWVIIEMLREQKEYRYSLKPKYALNSLAKELSTSVEECQNFIDDCVEEFDLFYMEDDHLSCETLDNRMARLDKRRTQAKAAADARWSGKKKPKAKPKEVEPKEINPEKIKTKEVLTNEKYWKIFKDQLMGSKEFSSVPDVMLDRERNKIVDWSASKGRVFKDWKAAFKNWLRQSREWSKGDDNDGGNNPNLKNPYNQ